MYNNNKWILSFTAEAIDPLLDDKPVDIDKLLYGGLQERFSALKPLASLTKTGIDVTGIQGVLVLLCKCSSTQ